MVESRVGALYVAQLKPRAHNLFEIKKMNDCKEGNLIDWGTKLQVGCLYIFGKDAQTMPEYYKYGCGMALASCPSPT